ncbi:MAG: class II aldolase/adducin family protein [Firmicutes bacterium]|uniref:Class II aldolase family protein n=1 Tax=Sulfobacillus benefaciens TaxID=453960 RepID=A0A2T2WY93_9FIRM|nr:class II aldolase/adducin family protein [Bacillota bacterium]MCL5015247.1 class II aldolase/adducin family protein [Bacillota bacterium]PSR27208.1 MAG: class II aldolase family protein [Sulfobacillus benefaciens]HBQ96640.1 class II aldolase family protein [Sulfobacillus sp.]
MRTTSPNEAREELVKTAHYLASHALLFRGNHANLSARISEDRIVMTRGGNIANLTVDDFALLTVHGQILEGNMDPVMAEIVDMHVAVYQVRPSCGAVIHTHAPHVTAFSVAQKSIPLVYEPLLRFGLTEPVPVIPWAPRGSKASVEQIRDIAQHHPGLPAVLMANHGILVFGDGPMETAALLGTLEEAAELYILAQSLGGAKLLPERAVQDVMERMQTFGSKH